MSNGRGNTRAKAKILRWTGVLGDDNRMLRWLVAIVLAVTGAALAFTQLGFVALSLPNERAGYVVVLLLVVALGSLLLGTLMGSALGFVVGGMLFLHAQFLPLDHYELMFVTPLTSIVMLGVMGLILGILFAFVLRNDPPQSKRTVYIIIVCVIVAFLYSIGFVVNVFISLAVSIVERMGENYSDAYVQQAAATLAMRLGSLNVQMWGTAFLMALLCSIADFTVRKLQERKGTLGLRAVFGSWLGVTVALAFMVMAAVSFGISSSDELRDGQESMRSEVGYLYDQIKTSDERTRLLQSVFEQSEFDFSKVDDATLEQLSDTLENKLVLDGYTVEDDGVVIVTIGNYVYACDDERFVYGRSLDEFFGSDALEAIQRSKDTGEMQRVVFDEAVFTDSDSEAESIADSELYLAYLYAEEVPSIIPEVSEAYENMSQNIIMMRSSEQVFAKRSSIMRWMTLSSFVLLLAVFVIVFQLLNRAVARRIDETNAVLERVTDGDLDARVEVRETREFESLSTGINTTVDTLKGWIAEAETRMDAELATARAIQEAALPRTFPPYPDVVKFDVYASMNAARQVGGDFYDFFLIGDDCNETSGKLGFLVADVSGKGVPAALFMMKAKALLHDFMASGIELGEAVDEANRQLVEGNNEDMFVTAWIGVLDYGTGHVDYVNAGHNPPLLWQREGGWRWMREKSGPVLGLFEVPYRTHSVECKAGDMFLLYTDGVTEAFDVDEQLYGEERLLAVAEKGYRKHARELLESVRSDVAAFAERAEQSDDITILTLEVGVPPEVTATLEVPAELSELDNVNEFLHAELDGRLCPQRVQNQLDIAVEELFVNVCRYAYVDAAPEVPCTVRIQRTYSAEPPSITVDIIDSGIAFDPLAKPDAVTPTDIMEVPIGGLGILMAKKSVDEMRYERTDGTNVVTIVKKW